VNRRAFTHASLQLDAPAKLNLSLAVVGQRADGFHELAGVTVLIELADRLRLLPGCAGLRLEGATGGVPAAPAANLAWRGLVAGLGGEPEDGCLTLEKRIPVAAGLGGGSSDAAAAWRLGRRWRSVDAAETPEATELGSLTGIGADVPFFAAAVPAAYVTGVGERIEPLAPDAEPPHVVLAHPPFGLETAAVFAELRREECSVDAPPRTLEAGRNDLFAAARRLRPELDELWALVVAAGGDPHMTGSGPTLFTMTHDPERASSVAARLERGDVRVTRTRLREAAASIVPIAEEE
jgi:4-diphosphocytidyl-2-C-methyl-D-erythritol kinase